MGCIVCLCSAALAAEKAITGVPSYIWYHGCGPTAGGMIIGYWDDYGYPDLIPGATNVWYDDPNDWPSADPNNDPVHAMIASGGHVYDYVPTPDRDPNIGGPYHGDDCLADFMLCSRDPRPYGSSFENQQHSGMTGYAYCQGYTGATGGWQYYGGLWNRLLSEVDANRPMELFVDTNGNGSGDHFVTAFGYRYDGNDPSNPSNPQYEYYNTYDHTARWADFVPITENQNYSIQSGSWFNPSGSLTESHSWVCGSAVGNWFAQENWDPNGTPAANWDADLLNVLDANEHRAIVDGNSVVSGLTVAGFAGPMTVAVQSGAVLTVTGTAQADFGGQIELQGGTLAAGLLKLTGGTLCGWGTHASPLAVEDREGTARVDDGNVLTLAGQIAWKEVLAKTGSGELDLALPGGTAVTVETWAGLRVSEGTVRVSGSADPFTDTADGNRHLDIANDGLLVIAAAIEAVAGQVTGIDANLLGTTQLDANSSLSVSKIVQDTVAIGAGATLTIRGSSGTSSPLSDAANDGMLDLDSCVPGREGSDAPIPEPGTLVLLSLGGLALSHRRRL